MRRMGMAIAALGVALTAGAGRAGVYDLDDPLQARYPELSMRADFDPQQAAVTRRRFLESTCDTSTLVCTAHFPSPSAGYVTRWGDGFRFAFAQ